MFTSTKSLVLASASPRRREMLTRLGIDYSVVASGVEETIDQGKPPELLCQQWARDKAEAVASRLGREEDRWYLAVDTVVVIDDRTLGKPGGKEQAREFLASLSGRQHRVISGYCIVHPPTNTRVSNVVVSEVKIKTLSPAEIDAYVETGEPMDKAGAYAVQGVGAFMVEEIFGSYTNVVGMPLTQVVEDLVRLGIIAISGGGKI